MTDTAIVDTTTSQDIYSQDYSRFLALSLDYVSRTSKVSCTSKELIAKTICDIALENDIDICFILAQGTIETHLGTTGIGKSRHSIFGVYRTFKDYDECINAYAKLLKKSYLTRGRTERDLMKRYVTTGGARYAGDTQYEQRLSKTYRDICKTHGALLELQRKLRRTT
jgi:flagellum-specific peptidoglycan hydrolase FlgJ